MKNLFLMLNDTKKVLLLLIKIFKNSHNEK